MTTQQPIIATYHLAAIAHEQYNTSKTPPIHDGVAVQLQWNNGPQIRVIGFYRDLGIYRDPQTIQTLRALEGAGYPITPAEATFSRQHDLHGVHLLKDGFRGVANGQNYHYLDVDLSNLEALNGWRPHRGWLLPTVIRDSSILNGRWLDWDYLELVGPDEETPIEKIPIFIDPVNRIDELLEYCLTLLAQDWRTNQEAKKAAVIYLFKWLLFGFGHPRQQELPIPPYGLHPNSFDLLAQVMPPSIKLLMLWPRAHFSYLVERCGLVPEGTITAGSELAQFEYLLRSSVEYPEQPVVIPQATGPDLLMASNFTNTIIPINHDEFVAVSAILDAYLHAPTAAIPSSWLFVNPAKLSESIEICSIKGSVMPDPLFDANYTTYYFPFLS